MQQLVLQLTGVSLDDSKGYLVETRLGRIAEKAGCANFNELYFKMRYGQDKALENEVVDAITTHESSWFRDGSPYDALQFKLLPEVIDARERLGQGRKLRIWSCACSTGQEPYGIGMVMKELIGDLAGWDIEILATDIGSATLLNAANGVYSDLEMSRTMRPQLTRKYFTKDAAGYRVHEEIRRLVRFQERNLLQPILGVGPFDIIFLRNVLIYFEPETRKDIVERVSRTLLPNGWLVVGASENLTDLGPRYRTQTHCGATVYQPNLQPVALR